MSESKTPRTHAFENTIPDDPNWANMDDAVEVMGRIEEDLYEARAEVQRLRDALILAEAKLIEYEHEQDGEYGECRTEAELEAGNHWSETVYTIRKVLSPEQKGGEG